MAFDFGTITPGYGAGPEANFGGFQPVATQPGALATAMGAGQLGGGGVMPFPTDGGALTKEQWRYLAQNGLLNSGGLTPPGLGGPTSVGENVGVTGVNTQGAISMNPTTGAIGTVASDPNVQESVSLAQAMEGGMGKALSVMGLVTGMPVAALATVANHVANALGLNDVSPDPGANTTGVGPGGGSASVGAAADAAAAAADAANAEGTAGVGPGAGDGWARGGSVRQRRHWLLDR